ncbi:MAG: hypothetical protein K2O67_05470 [Clostridia bacterium]|nr:hypothetical protein [Clostridia bacterium]
MSKLKHVIRFLIFFLLSLTIVFFSGCKFTDCIEDEIGKQLVKLFEWEGESMKQGDFVYGYINNDLGSYWLYKEGKNVTVFGLTKEGKQKETLIIPDEIDGKPVVQIGRTAIGPANYVKLRLDGGKYTRVYLPSSFMFIGAEDCISSRAWVFLVGRPNKELFNYENDKQRIYVSKTVYDEYKEYDEYDLLRIADVEYYSGEELYWLDNCSWSEPSSIIEPPIPVKEGYNFLGWVEENNETLWNFEIDKLDLTSVDEEGNHPTAKLFAKWEAK